MTIKEIDASLEEGESFKFIAQAYSEIANLKIKRVRANVERNRIFFQEISKIYAIVRNFAINKKVNISKPKKVVSMVLTSNHGFYGQSNSELLQFFIDTTQKFTTDRIIVGRTGIDFYKTQSKFTNFQAVLLKNDQPNNVELMNLVNLIKDYSRVLVFYSVLKSLLVQTPTATDITASSTPQLQTDNTTFKFIFEPELPKILDFFNSQVTTLLLESTFLECELARTASRFISMDEAESSSNKLIKEYQTIKAYTKRNMDNNTILENFAAMMVGRKAA